MPPRVNCWAVSFRSQQDSILKIVLTQPSFLDILNGLKDPLASGNPSAMSSSHLNVEKFRRKTTRKPEEPRQVKSSLVSPAKLILLSNGDCYHVGIEFPWQCFFLPIVFQAFQVFLCHPFKVHFYRHVPPVDCSNTSNFLRTTIDFTLRNKCCHLCHPRKDLEEHFYLVWIMVRLRDPKR